MALLRAVAVHGRPMALLRAVAEVPGADPAATEDAADPLAATDIAGDVIKRRASDTARSIE